MNVSGESYIVIPAKAGIHGQGRPVKYGNITPNWSDHRQIISRIANSDAAEARERMWRYVGAQVRDKHSDSGSARERAPRDNGN